MNIAEITDYIVRFLLLFLCAALDGFPCMPPTSTPFRPTNQSIRPTPRSSNTTKVYAWAPGPNDARIAVTSADMLEKFHYLHLPFDAALSSKMLDLYLNTLDPQHLHFTCKPTSRNSQKYRNNLGVLTKEKSTTPRPPLSFSTATSNASRNARLMRRNCCTMKPSSSRATTPFRSIARPPLTPRTWRTRNNSGANACVTNIIVEKMNRETPKELASLMAGRHTPMDLALAGHDFHRDIVKFIDTRYNRVLRNFQEYENDQVLETYLTSLARVYDPHSDYEDKDTLENFAIQMSLSLFGIGAVLQSDDDGYCKIVSLQPGMPAEKSKKLKPGDRIVAVAQGSKEPTDVVQMPLNESRRSHPRAQGHRGSPHRHPRRRRGYLHARDRGDRPRRNQTGRPASEGQADRNADPGRHQKIGRH